MWTPSEGPRGDQRGVTMLLLLLAAVGVALRLLWWLQARRNRFALSNRVVVITGGASGLGKQLAIALLRDAPDTTVALVDIDEAALRTTYQELRQMRLVGATSATGRGLTPSPEEDADAEARVHIFKCDVSSERWVLYGAVCIHNTRSSSFAPPGTAASWSLGEKDTLTAR
jgi:hypothetical protein